MGEITNAGEKKALEAVFNNTTTTYVMLLSPPTTATINDTTTLAAAAAYEVNADTGYTRKPIHWASAVLENGAMVVKNDQQIDFGLWLKDQTTSATNNGTIEFILVVSASSGTVGDILGFHQLTTELNPIKDQPVRIPVNGLSISID